MDAPLFQRPEGVVTAGVFLAHAHAVAAALPEGRYLINACVDRYAFAVGFAAGLMRGRTALLNAGPGQLAGYEGCTVVADGPVPGELPVTQVGTAPCGDAGAVPMIAAGTVAAIVFTSGSTGVPVPHAKLWGGLVARSRAAAGRFGLAGGCVVGTVPPQHMYGFETTVLLPLHAPVSSWCGPAFFPADVRAALAACPAARLLVTTPLQLRALVGVGLAVEGVVSATAPLDLALAAAVEAAWGAPVHEVFGATECGSIASRRTVTGPAWQLYAGVRIGLEDGQTMVQAPGMAAVALADEVALEGRAFRLLGRRTDVVKLGGRRASLPGLNQVLTGVAGVDDGAFVVPDDLEERSTARLVAVVVAPERSGAAILAELRGLLDPVFLPRRVILVPALPRNAMGKLPRQALLQLVAAAQE